MLCFPVMENGRDMYGMPIHEIAAEGRRSCSEELLANGEDVNSIDLLGWTPLMHAVHNGYFQLARKLLSLGAQVSIRNHHGITAFVIATLNFNQDLLKTLYDGLSPDLKQQESNTALLVACLIESKQTVQWLLQSTLAQVNAISPLTGISPLMLLAMTSGNCDIAELLLKSGADPCATSTLGPSVSELALMSGNSKLLSLLQFAASSSIDSMNFQKVKNTNFEFLDTILTPNQINLDIKSDKTLRNSPIRPVFKINDKNISDETVDKSLSSPSTRSVFLLSPVSGSPYKDPDKLNCQYNLTAIATPRKFITKTPHKGSKRKLSSVNGISSWFKKMTKRRSKSLAGEDDYEDLNIQQQNGVNFLKLLEGLGLEEFFPIFKEQELDIWTFLSLTVQDLAAMGINKASSQIRILSGIESLRKTQIY